MNVPSRGGAQVRATPLALDPATRRDQRRSSHDSPLPLSPADLLALLPALYRPGPRPPGQEPYVPHVPDEPGPGPAAAHLRGGAACTGCDLVSGLLRAARLPTGRRDPRGRLRDAFGPPEW